MKKLLIITALFFVGMIYAEAQGTVANFSEDFEEYWYNCNSGEDVYVTGTVHFVFKNNGTWHINAHGTGMNYDGGTYVFNYNDNFMPTENHGTWTAKVNLVGKGKTPDFKAKLTAHYTINANGDVVVDFFKVSDNCE